MISIYIFRFFTFCSALYCEYHVVGLPNNCTQDTTKRRDAYTSSKIFTNLTCGAKQSYDVVIMKPPLLELVEVHRILAIYADKGYTGKDFCDRIHTLTDIRMLPLPKSNTPQPPEEKLLRQHIFKVRRRIETTNSQLSDYLGIQCVREKSLVF